MLTDQGHGTLRRLILDQMMIECYLSPHFTTIPTGLQYNNSELQLKELTEAQTPSQEEYVGKPKVRRWEQKQY